MGSNFETYHELVTLRALHTARDFGATTPMIHVARTLPQWGPGYTKVRSTERALTFYLYEHIVGEIKKRRGAHGVLSQDERAFLLRYNTAMLVEARRLYYYLLLICVRESRHVSNKTTVAALAEKKNGALPAALFHSFLSSVEDHTNIHALCSKMETLGHVPLSAVVRGLMTVFDKGNFSSAYGGPKWGVIAKCLYLFVSGQSSPAQMLDQAWALAHNTCSIFNKGMLYSTDYAGLTEVLDVQRAGLLPQYVRAGAPQSSSVKVLPEHVALVITGAALFGPDWAPGGVDWAAVSKIGVGSYSHHIKWASEPQAKPQAKAPVTGLLNNSVVFKVPEPVR